MYQQDFRANHRLQTILCQKTCLHRYIHCPYVWIREFILNCTYNRISHRPTVRVIHLFEYHLSRTSSCIKITSDANHRLYIFYLVMFIVGHIQSKSVCLYGSSSIVRRISHRPTVRVIHLFEISPLQNIFMYQKTSAQITGSHFLSFRFVIFIVGHNSLSVCLYGHPSIVRSVFKLSRPTDPISFNSIITINRAIITLSNNWNSLHSIQKFDFRANHNSSGIF